MSFKINKNKFTLSGRRIRKGYKYCADTEGCWNKGIFLKHTGEHEKKQTKSKGFWTSILPFANKQVC